VIRPDIQAMAAKWIGELRLQDRIVRVEYVRDLRNPFGEPVYGLMQIENLDEGRFCVSIQDPDTWPVGGVRELSEESIEEGLVHELVHIRWIDVTADNANPAAIRQEERATWATATALLRAGKRQRASIVRAMSAHPAQWQKVQRAALARDGGASRSALARSKAMIDAATAKQLLDALDTGDPDAMKMAIRGIVEAALTGGDSAPPGAIETPPMPADAGNGATPDDKEKSPMQMAPDKYARSMKAATEEAVAALAVLRPAVKVELVRAMRADGITVTPHAERLVLDAPTVQDAERLVAGMRAMSPGGTSSAKPHAQPPTDASALAGLTRSQKAKYEDIAKSNPRRAETYRTESLKANAEAAARKGS